MTLLNRLRSNLSKYFDSIKIILQRNSHKIKIISIFTFFIVFFISVVKINAFYKKYSSYRDGNAFLKANKYVEAVNRLALAGDYKDAKDKLKIASKHVFGQLDDCLKQIGMEMVICPAGSYVEIKKDSNSQKTIHNTVTINSPFAIGKYEVTLAQYLLIMGKNISNNTNILKPINHITWNDANKFCEKINKMFANKLPNNYKFDLPTDSQWEYACRAGKNSKFYIGPTEGNSDEVAWYVDNSDDDIQLIGQKRPNDWEIYDMHGNVWEWCKNSCEKCEYLIANATDSTKLETPTCRVLRGGSFCDKIGKRKAYAYTTISYKSVGFRLAFVPTSL